MLFFCPWCFKHNRLLIVLFAEVRVLCVLRYEGYTWEEKCAFHFQTWSRTYAAQLPQTCGWRLRLFSETFDCETKSQSACFVTLRVPQCPIFPWRAPNRSRLKLRYQTRWGQWWWKKKKSLGDSIIFTCTRISHIPTKDAVCDRETCVVTLMSCCSYQLPLPRFGNKHNKPWNEPGNMHDLSENHVKSILLY